MDRRHLVERRVGQRALNLELTAARGRSRHLARALFRGRSSRVWVLTAVLFAVTLLLYIGPLAHLGPSEGRHIFPWWAIGLAFFIADRNLVHLEFRRHSHSYSLFELPLVMGLFFASPAAMVLGQLANLLGSAFEKRDPVKKAFNVANSALSVGVAIWIFHGLSAGAGPTSLRNWAACFAATLAAALIEAPMVMLAMYLATGEVSWTGVRRGVGFAVLVVGTNTSLATMAATLVWFDAKAAFLFLVPTGVLFWAYRSYVWQRRKSDSLESLYESTRVLHHSIDSEPATHDLLRQAKKMFRAEKAEFLLFASAENDAHVRVSLDGDDQLHVAKFTVLDPNKGVWARVAAQNAALLVPRPIRDPALVAALEGTEIRDAMVAPLRGEKGVIGTLRVANRIGETFLRDDLPLFETLANHASVSIANATLMDRLREEAAEKEYQALHDTLTGLPNRTLFRDRIEQAIVALHGSESSLAVMLVDLDRFMEVNDTLGHHNGDLLLLDVARRLRVALDPEVTVARFSGDEFAVLMPCVEDVQMLAGAAGDVLGVLEDPFTVAGVELKLDASIGIAIHPLHGDDAHKLIQRADVAMYVAKEAHSGFEIYSTDQDGYSPARLALAAELRQAIDNHDLVVYYQPKADFKQGRVTGAEALVRWTHPEHGFLPPDEFIPLAEHTGLIRPLTKLVLEDALRQCAAWRSEGLFLDVSVNLSVRSLLDLQLPETVESLLARYDVDPKQLILEITESSIMADPIRAAGVVDALHELGVGLAIDDFGTGYSSLSYLKRLPVSEIKIDKSFVMSMGDDDNDAVIVRSTVDLGQNLGLRVVAEGVETLEVWDELKLLGCDIAQGYFLSRPLPAGEIASWIASWTEPSKAPLAELQVTA